MIFNTRIFQSLVLCLTLSCQPSGNSEKAKPDEKQMGVKVASWLIGEWGNTSEQGTLYESWVADNDSVFTGRSYFIRHGDTVSSEAIKLVQLKDSIYYIPVVRNQNDGMAVKFKLVSYDSATLRFENLSHDFPQKITYHKVSPDSLFAEISGIVKGELRSEKFPMAKIK
jgi:hypothetical protein